MAGTGRFRNFGGPPKEALSPKRGPRGGMLHGYVKETDTAVFSDLLRFQKHFHARTLHSERGEPALRVRYHQHLNSAASRAKATARSNAGGRQAEKVGDIIKALQK